MNDKFILALEELFKNSKIAPAQIDIEITENVFLNVNGHGIRNIHRLIDMGFLDSLR